MTPPPERVERQALERIAGIADEDLGIVGISGVEDLRQIARDALSEDVEQPAGVDTAMRVAGHLPILRPGERDCPTCQGRGYVYLNAVCPKCNGERKVPVPANPQQEEGA